MVKIIIRTTDNKFLKSVEGDVWVDDKKDAFEMTHRESLAAIEALLNTYEEKQLKLIYNFSKHKPISDEERKEFSDYIKGKK
jgi:hypothetical protein